MFWQIFHNLIWNVKYSKKKTIAQKICENVGVNQKSAYVIYEIYLRKQFKDADANSSGCLSFNECIKVLGQLNIKMEKEQLKKLFKEANFITDYNEDSLNEAEFVAFYYSLLKRPEVEEVFIKYATNTVAASGPKMTVSDLMDFFAKEEKNPYSSAKSHQLGFWTNER